MWSWYAAAKLATGSPFVTPQGSQLQAELSQCTTSPQLGPDLEEDRGLLGDCLLVLDQQVRAQLESQQVLPGGSWTGFWSGGWPGLNAISFDSWDPALGIRKGFSASISDSKPVSKATKPQVHLQLNYSQTSSRAMCSQIRVLLQDT